MWRPRDVSSNSLTLHGLGKDRHLLAGNMAPVGLSRLYNGAGSRAVLVLGIVRLDLVALLFFEAQESCS
jgi:hypothetical protein